MSLNFKQLEKTAKNILWRVPGWCFPKRKPGLSLDLADIKSVLVVRPDRLGDVILSTPVYRSIKSSLPGVRLTVLVDKSNAGLLKSDPNVDRVLEWDSSRPFKILRPLRREKYDLAFTLNKTFSATASALTFLSRAACRVGYENPKNAWMLDVQVGADTPPRHEVENNLELLKAVGLTKIVTTPKLYFNAQEEQAVDSLLKDKRKQTDRPLVLIKPGTRVPAWGWRLEKFQQVAEHLLKTETAEVFLISGPGEEKMTDGFMNAIEHPPVRLPPLSVMELALLIQKSDLLFCNHTGIMHLASAVNTPVLAIFKHGEIARWGPYHTPNVILEERHSDALTPETVLESIGKLLKMGKNRLQEESGH
jgi:ADP-heptose:LPS heptosyltransferase